MAKLLYITCNVKAQNQSRTLTLGYEFLEEYLRCNPRDEVQILDLYRDSIQRVDKDVLNAWERMERREYLSDEERNKMGRLWRLVDQFGRCDKYVFVSCSTPLRLPAEFKTYINTICVTNRSYRHMQNEAEEVLLDRPRKSLHLHAVPNPSNGHEHDQSITYLSSVLNYLGITDQESVLVNGDDPERASINEHEAAHCRLLELARIF